MVENIYKNVFVFRSFHIIAVLMLSVLCSLSWAEDAVVAPEITPVSTLPLIMQEVPLEAHEANRIGLTKDSDDQPFMDFLVSTQHPIALERLREKNSSWLPYFAFTGRFGQYIGQRESSPVIVKRFNPKLFMRHFMSGENIQNKDNPSSYVDFEYAHESNGQSINSQQSYDAVANAPNNNPEYAKDNLSRGWDYFGVSGKNKIADQTFGYGFRYFLNKGLIQSEIEEYMTWEGERSITHINQVSGIHLSTGWNANVKIFDSVTMGIETGYNQPFKYTTFEIDVVIKPLYHALGIPVVLWIRTGYSSDMAQYYEHVSSYGFALKFESFKGGSKPVSVM